MEQTCYRHTDRETGVSCSACGRPICPDCMTTTSVGMRCPECSREKTKVRNLRSTRTQPTATYVLIGINVLVFIAACVLDPQAALRGGGELNARGDLYSAVVGGQHEYWRLLTSGFLHAGPIHLLLNMFFIYVLGGMLEPALGRPRFVALYFVALFGGSLGALLLSPDSPTVGASGAAFGLLGGAIVLARDRGIPIWESGLGATLLINVVFTVSFAGKISLGGHLGGLIAGGLAALVLVELGERRRQDVLAYLGCLALAAVCVAGALAAAHGSVA
jgi:membrane associated rhomboid family serine protease